MCFQKNLRDSLIFLLAVSAILFLDDFDVGITLHMLVYIFVAKILITSIFNPSSSSKRKAIAGLSYYSLLLFQITYLVLSDFSIHSRILAASLLLMVFAVERLFINHKQKYFITPTLDDNSLSFEDLRYVKRKLQQKSIKLKRVGGVLTPSSLKEMLCEIPRNCSIRYVNKDSLSDTYLKNLDSTLLDPNVYLIFSDTGSVASNFIGIFTNKPYNHISISFDSELKTLISYNGGERLSPPGLNPEMLEWFYKKESASIRIYRLEVTLEQKLGMAEKVKQINREGSAYNLLGITIRKSLQPNMMVCSEFVYSLLSSVGAEYFQKNPLQTKPSDMIELDYERKLHFVEAIQLSALYNAPVTREQIAEAKQMKISSIS